MKIGEILRQLADIVDAEDAEKTQEIGDPAMSGQAGTGDSPDQVYVGPLQQKHELLKKATGKYKVIGIGRDDKKLINNVDQFADDDEELTKMQQNAGVAPTVINQTFEIGTAQQASQPNPAIISTLADLTDSD